jgi:paraquat-inducible protein A
MPDVDSLIACHECDLLQQEVSLPRGGMARCHRCNAQLYRSHPRGLERALAFALAALVMFVICNAFPIIGLEVAGEIAEATLFGTVRAVYQDRMWLVAGLILFTTILAPLAHILAMLYVLLPLRWERRPHRPELVLRLLTGVRQWGMIEVFVLGILVALVKLNSMAAVIPGIALWSFGALMILFTAASVAFDPRQVWARIDEVSA